MKLPKKGIKVPKNLFVPHLELESSSLGTKKFQEGNYFWNSYVLRNQHDTNGEGSTVYMETTEPSIFQ